MSLNLLNNFPRLPEFPLFVFKRHFCSAKILLDIESKILQDFEYFTKLIEYATQDSSEKEFCIENDKIT